jgi:signal transduction histidine kinase
VGFKVWTPDAGRLAKVALAAEGKARVWETQQPGVTVRRLPASRIAELAAAEGIAIAEMRPTNAVLNWLEGRMRDPVSWRACGYFAVKPSLAVAGLVVAAGGWLGGLFYLTAPGLVVVAPAVLPVRRFPFLGHASPFVLLPLGAAMLLAGPWLLHGITEADRRLIRGLLGPSSPAERIRALEESRARAVDDSAARLRSIERDLHDGTQAQLVALAMKLGLARDKLQVGDLARVTRLVEDAHRGALEAIADLRTLARGIHPPVLISMTRSLSSAMAAQNSAARPTRPRRCGSASR